MSIKLSESTNVVAVDRMTSAACVSEALQFFGRNRTHYRRTMTIHMSMSNVPHAIPSVYLQGDSSFLSLPRLPAAIIFSSREDTLVAFLSSLFLACLETNCTSASSSIYLHTHRTAPHFNAQRTSSRNAFEQYPQSSRIHHQPSQLNRPRRRTFLQQDNHRISLIIQSSNTL